jgi:sugar-specific transcriptional regulator TrmB
MQNPKSTLQSLGLTESEIRVYLSMVSGAKNIKEILKTTQLKRPTAYYAINSLRKRGLITKPVQENTMTFTLEPYERLETLVEEKSREIVSLSSEIDKLIPLFTQKKNKKDQKPMVSFYEGVEAVKNIVMETLYCKSKQILSIAPQDNFFWQIGEDFVKIYIDERKKRNIETRNLWEKRIDQDVYEENYREYSSVKILPEVMKGKFATTIFMYDDKTLYISSLTNAYCILIQSQEHKDMMTALFEGLWFASEKH